MTSDGWPRRSSRGQPWLPTAWRALLGRVERANGRQVAEQLRAAVAVSAKPRMLALHDHRLVAVRADLVGAKRRVRNADVIHVPDGTRCDGRPTQQSPLRLDLDLSPLPGHVAPAPGFTACEGSRRPRRLGQGSSSPSWRCPIRLGIRR